MSIEDDINSLKRPLVEGSAGHIDDHQKIASVLEELNNEVAAQSAPVIKRAVQTFGAAGSNGTANVSNVCVRIPFRLGVTSLRWRLRISGYNVRNASNGGGAHYFRGATVGPYGSFGNFASTPMIAIPDPGATANAVPQNTNTLVTDWVTNPAHQLGLENETLVAVQINGPTGTVPRGFNAAFGSWGTNDAVEQTVSTSAWAFTPWDIAIEYEFATTENIKKVGVYIGDSNTEGFGGDASGAFQWQKFTTIHSRMSGAVDINLGVSGIQASNYGTTGYRLNRIPWADINPDYVVVGLGTNDANANANRSLAQFQTDIRAIWTELRNKGVKTIYTILPMPRTAFPAGALNSAVSAGATSIQTSVAFNANDYICLNVPGAGREVVQAASNSTGSAGSHTTTLVAATTLAHASGAPAMHNGQALLDSYRTWLATGPDGIIPLDADVPMRDFTRPWALLPEYTTDGTHLSHRGMAVVGQRLSFNSK